MGLLLLRQIGAQLVGLLLGTAALLVQILDPVLDGVQSAFFVATKGPRYSLDRHPEDLTMRADAVVKARIPVETKERATAALERMGLSVSDVIRLTLMRVAEEGRLPFDVAIPNATTRKAMKELDAGKGKRFDSVEALFDE